MRARCSECSSGDERGDVDFAVGEHVQRVAELKRGMAEHEPQVTISAAGSQRSIEASLSRRQRGETGHAPTVPSRPALRPPRPTMHRVAGHPRPQRPDSPTPSTEQRAVTSAARKAPIAPTGGRCDHVPSTGSPQPPACPARRPVHRLVLQP